MELSVWILQLSYCLLQRVFMYLKVVKSRTVSGSGKLNLMDDVPREPKRLRGTALLVATIIILSSFIILEAVPPDYNDSELNVRVAVIDSGMNIDSSLQQRIIAQMSFINESYGYEETENSTLDSMPLNSLHGTYIAKIIARDAPNAAIINAKVVGDDNTATPVGIVQAIYWSVLVANCNIINLSLGMDIISGDIVEDAVRWAFQQGVCIVAAAGNNGQDGISGSSIDSPAAYPEAIAVAAIDDLLAPYSFSGRGPLRNRIVKPDIAASGYYVENGGTLFGTSFAAPIISAGAARIIEFCLSNKWAWTPGLVKAAIMASASKIPLEVWEVGVGKFNLENALNYINNAQKADTLPLIAAVTPSDGPFSFERWFVNQTIRLPISIFTSNEVTFTLAYRGEASQWLEGPSEVTINQTGSITLELCVVSSINLEDLSAWVSFIAPDYVNLRTSLRFDVIVPYRKIAFDISTTPWAIDSVYGQFRELAWAVQKLGISVDEIRIQNEISLQRLSQYDAVFVLDPCAWDYVLINNTITKVARYSYTPTRINSYVQYWEQGGNLFLVGLSNLSIDVTSANQLFSAFNISLNYDRVPGITIVVNGISSTLEITSMIEHPVTSFLDSFDYNGCSLNYTGDVLELAWTQVGVLDPINQTTHYENRTVLVGLEGVNDGRIVATGSNFFVDNWALNGLYHSEQNYRLSLQVLYWLLHII